MVVEDEQPIRILDAQLRYFFHIDPDLLNDEQWAMRVQELNWIREQEAKQNQA